MRIIKSHSKNFVKSVVSVFALLSFTSAVSAYKQAGIQELELELATTPCITNNHNDYEANALARFSEHDKTLKAIAEDYGVVLSDQSSENVNQLTLQHMINNTRSSNLLSPLNKIRSDAYLVAALSRVNNGDCLFFVPNSRL